MINNDSEDINLSETILDMVEQTMQRERAFGVDNLLDIDGFLDFLRLPMQETNTSDAETHTSDAETHTSDAETQTQHHIELHRPLSMPNLILPIRNYTSTTRYPNINIPMSNAYENILATSLGSFNPVYKKVLSKEGEAQLKRIKYDPSIHKQNICPITQNEFKPGDEVTELPCNHYFEHEAIEHWLKHEKAECPVCRLKLEANEERVTEQTSEQINNEYNENNDDEERANSIISLATNRMHLYNSLMRSSENHPFGPRRGMEYLIGEQDTDDLQTAIIASLLDV